MPATTDREPTWVDRTAGARILDADPRVLDRLVAEGLVGVRNLPVRAKYRLADLKNLARLSLVPARARGVDPRL